MTKREKALLKLLTDKFFHADCYPPDVRLTVDQVAIIATGLAKIAVKTIRRKPA